VTFNFTQLHSSMTALIRNEMAHYKTFAASQGIENDAETGMSLAAQEQAIADAATKAEQSSTIDLIANSIVALYALYRMIVVLI
jgi:hypothetical protein